MASILKVDTITGVTTAGSIAVTGEGNSTTTNLQQGLAKAWCQYNASTALQDSFNVTSLTDTGTGGTTVTIANNMANDDYSATGNGADGDASSTITSLNPNTYATGSVKYTGLRQTDGANDVPANNDLNFCNVCILGDLA